MPRPAEPRKAASRGAAVAPPVSYVVEVADAHAHLFRVTLTIARPARSQRLSLPVWIPGSYLVREFARHLQGLQARQGARVRACVQRDKCSWEVQASEEQPLVLQYHVYALDNSVRTAWLDAARGFFNGTSLLLRVHGQEDVPHRLEVRRPEGADGWQLATGLQPARKLPAHGFGAYHAADYDELVDSPVEMGAFWSGSFRACGVRHRFVVAGAAPSFDGQRLLEDSQRICEQAIRFWHAGPDGKRLAHKPPQQDYVFLLNVVDDGYGGLEHRNSTALICGRKDLPRLASGKGETWKATDGYTTLLGLISHEYFHIWNVKRLRPVEFARYDYTRENHTRLLWFFEGFTSYYDDLLLRRAGLLDDTAYLRLLTKSLNQVLQTPGRKVHSVADASFEAWTKYYRQDENTPNTTVSYYTKGAAVGLCLDLTLRAEGRSTLDAVMRGLWQRCNAGPMREQDLLDELQAQTGRDWAAEIRAWVHGTAELPLQRLLEQRGVSVLEEPAQPAQTLGLRVAEGSGAVQVKVVLADSPAQRAGFSAGDEWLGVEVPAKGRRSASAWRLHKLDELALYAPAGTEVLALVARDRRLLRLPLRLPQSATTWRLAARDTAQITAWLAP